MWGYEPRSARNSRAAPAATNSTPSRTPEVSGPPPAATVRATSAIPMRIIRTDITCVEVRRSWRGGDIAAHSLVTGHPVRAVARTGWHRGVSGQAVGDQELVRHGGR